MAVAFLATDDGTELEALRPGSYEPVIGSAPVEPDSSRRRRIPPRRTLAAAMVLFVLAQGPIAARTAVLRRGEAAQVAELEHLLRTVVALSVAEDAAVSRVEVVLHAAGREGTRVEDELVGIVWREHLRRLTDVRREVDSVQPGNERVAAIREGLLAFVDERREVPSCS